MTPLRDPDDTTPTARKKLVGGNAINPQHGSRASQNHEHAHPSCTIKPGGPERINITEDRGVP
jgi:hypothetical protein